MTHHYNRSGQLAQPPAVQSDEALEGLFARLFDDCTDCSHIPQVCETDASGSRVP